MSCFVQQITVENHHCSHGFDNRYGAWHNAGVMPTARMENHRIAAAGYGWHVLQQCRYRLESNPEIYILSIGYAALNATGMIG